MKLTLLANKYSRVGSSITKQPESNDFPNSYNSRTSSKGAHKSGIKNSHVIYDHSMHPPSPKVHKQTDEEIIKMNAYLPKRSFNNGVNNSKYLMFGNGGLLNSDDSASNSFAPVNQPPIENTNKLIVNATRESLRQYSLGNERIKSNSKSNERIKSNSKSRNSISETKSPEQITLPLVKNDSLKQTNNQAKIKINIKNKLNEENDEVVRREIQLNYYKSDGINKSSKMLSELSDVPGSYLKSNLLIRYTNNQDIFSKSVRRSISNLNLICSFGTPITKTYLAKA